MQDFKIVTKTHSLTDIVVPRAATAKLKVRNHRRACPKPSQRGKINELFS